MTSCPTLSEYWKMQPPLAHHASVPHSHPHAMPNTDCVSLTFHSSSHQHCCSCLVELVNCGIAQHVDTRIVGCTFHFTNPKAHLATVPVLYQHHSSSTYPLNSATSSMSMPSAANITLCTRPLESCTSVPTPTTSSPYYAPAVKSTLKPTLSSTRKISSPSALRNPSTGS